MAKKKAAESSQRASENATRFNVTVHPRSSAELLAILPDGSLDIRLKAPPIEGRANENLIKYLSDYFHIRKSAIKIEQGEKSRKKVISITGLTKEEVTNHIKCHG
jgi:uncharacterized protein